MFSRGYCHSVIGKVTYDCYWWQVIPLYGVNYNNHNEGTSFPWGLSLINLRIRTIMTIDHMPGASKVGDAHLQK